MRTLDNANKTIIGVNSFIAPKDGCKESEEDYEWFIGVMANRDNGEEFLFT